MLQTVAKPKKTARRSRQRLGCVRFTAAWGRARITGIRPDSRNESGDKSHALQTLARGSAISGLHTPARIRKRCALLSCLLSLAFASAPATAATLVCELSRDEQIVFYPTLGARVNGGANWELEIHGCVYEPESRRLTLATLRKALALEHVKMTKAETATFNQRARLFLADNQRGHRAVVRVGSREFDLGESAPDGHFSGTVRLSETELGLGSGRLDGKSVTLSTVLRPKDKRSFAGEILLLDDAGVSVISDIDDTIKITEVRDRHAMLRNTFLRDFQAVRGMPEFYQTLARSNRAAFHFVSASPWQLYTPLADFTRSNGFPNATFHLKTFRLKDRTFFSLFDDPEKFKPGVIEPLLKRFPNRRLILIGDSGERDPEIYGKLARRHPRQIARIFIRDVTGEPATAERYQRAFAELPPNCWQIFREPREIKVALD
jgi:hypothetical protein